MVSLKDIKMLVPIFFDKRKDEYTAWWPQFKAYATQKEFDEACNKTRNPKLPTHEVEFETDGVTPKTCTHTKEEKQAVIKNKMAIATFTIAFAKTRTCMVFVEDSRTRDWPSGQSHLVVIELLDEYAPTDLMGKVEQQRQMQNISMKETEDPKILFEQITMITQKFKDRSNELSNDEKVAAIILNAPDRYQDYILNLRDAAKARTGDEQAEPTLKVLKKGMHNLWNAKNRKSNDSTTQEVTLFSRESESNDSGGRNNSTRRNHSNVRCYSCGEKGHIKRDCEKPEKKCSECGKTGHVAAVCWVKNPDQRPNWLKKKQARQRNEIAAGAITEYSFMAISFDEQESQEEFNNERFEEIFDSSMVGSELQSGYTSHSEEEDEDEDSLEGMPELMKRVYDDDDSEDEDSDDEESLEGMMKRMPALIKNPYDFDEEYDEQEDVVEIEIEINDEEEVKVGEVSLMNQEPELPKKIQVPMGTTLDLLWKDSMWIGDTGSSQNQMNSLKQLLF